MTDAKNSRAITWVVATILVATTSQSARGSETMLATDRWQDMAYGLSLRPPIGSVHTPWPTGNIRMRFGGSGGYTVDLFIRTKRERDDEAIGTSSLIVALDETSTDRFTWQISGGDGDVTLERVETIAQKAMEVADPTAVMIDRKDLNPGGRPASVIYFKLSPTRTLSQQTPAGDWVIGQAFMPLKRNTFAVLRLQVDHDQFANIRPVFEAMVHSIQLENRQTLQDQREEWINRGRMWLELLDHDRLHHRITAEQYFRIRREDADIGYMLVRQRETREMELPGLGIEIVASVNRGRKVYDSQTRMFLSHDGHHEIWSIQMWSRAMGPAGQPVAATHLDKMARQETGVRSHDMIEIKRDGPMGPTTRSWKRPPRAYLSQVELQLMGPLLPHRHRQRMAFYGYHPDTGRITMRTVNIVPAGDGSYRAYSRASLDHPDDVSTYDRDGRLIRRNLPGGIVIEPATPQKMKSIWVDGMRMNVPQK